MEKSGHYNPQVMVRRRKVDSSLGKQAWIVYSERGYIPKSPSLQTIFRIRQPLENQGGILLVKVGELERLVFTRLDSLHDALKYPFGHCLCQEEVLD